MPLTGDTTPCWAAEGFLEPVEIGEGSPRPKIESVLPAEFSLTSARFEPSSRSLVLRVAVPAPLGGSAKSDRVTIKLFSGTGRFVSSYSFDNIEPGFKTLRIDPRNAGGAGFVPGFYICHVKTSGFRKALQVVCSGF